MVNYTYFYKAALQLDGPAPLGNEKWDILLSTYTEAERVKYVFDRISAGSKHWLVAPEYGFSSHEAPSGAYFGESHEEAELLQGFLGSLGQDLARCKLCIDITGFIRPHLMFLMSWLKDNGVHRFDALYTEPDHYEKREETVFSKGAVGEVRQVAGFEGAHNPDTSRDVIIIGSGYDHSLIAQIAESKDHASKVQVIGLPSLRADMFQENILRATRAEDAVGGRTGVETSIRFAPANDPFVTASVLRSIVDDFEAREPITNLYLSPLATKPQAIGFALYYLTERSGGAASIIFPFRTSYSRETAKGISRVWKYTVEFH
jgi:hypothetical protein